jgi:8-oxo-dGTP diphosphatase
MYTIYYGTNNITKIQFMKNRLRELSINIIGINEIKNIDHNIDENGKDPLENAKIKAWHYYKQINMPVFSADSGLFFDNVDYMDQPGINIRQKNGKKLDDNEMIEYYSKLAKKYGGEIIGYYKNGIYIIINEEKIMEISNEKINSEKFILTSEPHEKIIEGFPLDSLSKEINSGKYYYDIRNNKYNELSDEEYKKIFKEVIENIKTMN